MTDAPRIDVVILAWNDADVLPAAVASALDSVGVSPRVVVVDNGSEPPVPPHDDDRVTVVRSPDNLGVPAGRNLGMRHGEAEWACFLDSDARLEPTCLVRLVEPLRDDPSVGLAAPVYRDQLPSASAGLAPTLSDKVLRMTGRRDTYRADEPPAGAPWWEVDFAIGACQLIRRAAFDRVGGLDGRYRFGPEDVDFCLRLWQHGYRVVQVAAASCFHPARRGHRNVFSVRGVRHVAALLPHLWKHRHFRRPQ